MVDKKITELDTSIVLASVDIFPFVDIGSSTTKSITFGNIGSNISIPASQVSDFDAEVANNSAVTLNTAKNTNVTTNLSLGTKTATTMDVNSSDGTNATLVEADTTYAGLLGSDKWDEIVVNNNKISYNSTASTKLGTIEESADVTDATNVASAGAAMSGGAFHDGFSDFVADEHIDWTLTNVANIHADNYTDTDTQLIESDITTMGFTKDVEVDWTADQGVNNIHSGNYTDTDTQLSDGDIGAFGYTKDVEVDWTVDQGATNIHSGNYTDTDTTDHTALSNIGTQTHAQLETAIDLNTAKETDVDHNVSTDLSAGTRAPTTIDVNSSDGTNATLVEADTTNAGILGSAKWDEIVANTSAKHTQDTDTALGSGAVAADHGTATTDQIINVCYGTGDPPAANTTTEGSLFVQYTA